MHYMLNQQAIVPERGDRKRHGTASSITIRDSSKGRGEEGMRGKAKEGKEKECCLNCLNDLCKGTEHEEWR